MPEWLVSRVCEEFGCTASAAEQELETNGVLVMRILDFRNFARTRQAIRHATDQKALPKGPMADWVWQVFEERIQEG